MLKSPSKNNQLLAKLWPKMAKTWDFYASMAITWPKVDIFG
jgi:hypothetical protein